MNLYFNLFLKIHFIWLLLAPFLMEVFAWHCPLLNLVSPKSLQGLPPVQQPLPGCDIGHKLLFQSVAQAQNQSFSLRGFFIQLIQACLWFGTAHICSSNDKYLIKDLCH